MYMIWRQVQCVNSKFVLVSCFFHIFNFLHEGLNFFIVFESFVVKTLILKVIILITIIILKHVTIYFANKISSFNI